MTVSLFIREALSENNVPSSKRLAGFIGWCVCQLCVIAATVLELVIAHGLVTVSALIITDMTLSAGLIGLTTILSAVNGNQVHVGEVKQEKTE